MGKKKSKTRGIFSSSARVVAAAISEADIEEACRAGDLMKLRRWARQGVRVATAKPLRIAVTNGFLDVIRCLVMELGADVDQDTPFRGSAAGDRQVVATPLFIAAGLGLLLVVNCLVKELGANPYLISKPAGFTPVIIASQNGYLEVLRFLVNEAGADVNQGANNGDTPLYIAAKKDNQNLDVVRCLIAECGASVNQANSNGVSPLYTAAWHSHIDMVRCLITEFGADVDQAQENGITPLMSAVAFNNQDLIKHLVHKGANVRAATKDGDTAAMLLREVATATAAQIMYLEVRECCANPGCDGGGRKRCAVCKETRYCGKLCQIAHWRVHRVGCQLPIDPDAE
jgi:ankyrin repeat protein